MDDLARLSFKKETLLSTLLHISCDVLLKKITSIDGEHIKVGSPPTELQNDSLPIPCRVWTGAFLSVAWPNGVQLLVFFCSSVPVVLFDTPGISRCRSQHISVESSSLLHHSIYL